MVSLVGLISVNANFGAWNNICATGSRIARLKDRIVKTSHPHSCSWPCVIFIYIYAINIFIFQLNGLFLFYWRKMEHNRPSCLHSMVGLGSKSQSIYLFVWLITSVETDRNQVIASLLATSAYYLALCLFTMILLYGKFWLPRSFQIPFS